MKLLRLAGAALLGLVIALACCGYAAAQQTIWPGTTVPATIDNGASGPLELGVSFKSDVSGTVTGIRFYKSAANTGVHVGHLWSSTGALLATVTFTGETASGWQQASFSTPVAITANIVYVASYNMTVGHFSADWNYFATAGFNNVPLHALQTPNGVFGTLGAYPTNTHQAANYWVDVVFKSASISATAAYGLNEGSGSTTADATGNGNTGTLASASWTTGGRYGDALTFNGSSGDVEAVNSNSLNPGTAATFSAWLKVVGANSNISSIINKWSQTADDEYLFGLDSGNHLTFAWQTTGGNVWGQPSYNLVSGTAQVPLNTWTYVTVVRNGPAISFFINGNLDATFGAAADANPFRSGINTLRIGGQNRGGVARVLNGTIDELRLYNQALTQSQIQSEMNTPIGAAAAVRPSIATQPQSQSVTAGQTATFSVTATGTAPLTYQWQKNGVAISGATSTSYTTPATTTSDNGTQFTVAVSNSQGSVTSNGVTLSVGTTTLVAPAITTQPSSKSILVGQTAAFQVGASGTGPLSYQWRKNGTAISGATSTSYTTPTTTTSDNGSQFSVVVSNTAGNVTSNAATLTVNASTYALSASPTSLSFGSIDTSATSTLGVTLTNSGNSNVTISSVSTTGAGFSASNVSSATVLAPGQTAALNVTFAPTSTGSVTGGVTVASNATNSPATISMTGTGVQSNFSTWVSPSLNRVGKTDTPGTLSSIALIGARGETVDTQVVVQGPAGGLTNVNVSATALTGPNGVTIAASSVTLYREYYITVTGTASYGGGSNPPLGSGTYAEPLIPFNDPETGAALCGSSATLKACNASVGSGQNQPYWIDISIPHGASNSPAGTYTGSVTVSSSQGTSTIPVSLTVWNFELPMQPSELSLWTLFPAASGNTTTTLARALMRNKVMGWYDPAGTASSDVTNMGLNRSGLDSYYYIGIQCNGSYSSIPTTSQINTAAANFPPGLGLDFYLSDELNGCTGDYNAIKTMGTNAHAANRSVKTMVTLNATDPNLYGAVDHWVLLDSLQQWPTLPFTAGGDLWSYTSCNAGYGNAPEWMVDYPPINERIQAGFLNFTQGATGLLYYRADGWTAGNAIGSWNNVDTTACGGGLGRPGDGIFLYPPAPIGSTESAPGIRLKAIRDGIQDYEYAQILKNLGQLSVVDSTVLPIASSWSNWSHDPNALQTARTKLGQLLHQLAP